MNYKLDVELSEELEPYRSAIEATIKPYVKIELTDNNNPTWWQSKFGGFPYMPKDFDYPKSDDGEYLYLLAQINFAEVPKIEGLPEKGILQFYIANDSNYPYGCDFNNPTKQKNFRVLYFKDICFHKKDILTDFSFFPTLPFEEDYLPFEGSSKITFKIEYYPISIEDYQFEFKIFKDNQYANKKHRKIYDEYSHKFNSQEHKLLGYPCFYKVDPRERLHNHSRDNKKYTLLFQICDDGDENGFSIGWGMGGQGNFFIMQSDLENLRF